MNIVGMFSLIFFDKTKNLFRTSFK